MEDALDVMREAVTHDCGPIGWRRLPPDYDTVFICRCGKVIDAESYFLTAEKLGWRPDIPPKGTPSGPE